MGSEGPQDLPRQLSEMILLWLYVFSQWNGLNIFMGPHRKATKLLKTSENFSCSGRKGGKKVNHFVGLKSVNTYQFIRTAMHPSPLPNPVRQLLKSHSAPTP